MASAVANLANRSSNNTRFNAEAASWDSRPLVHDASRKAADAIRTKLSSLSIPSEALQVLEIGCGTGILSFLLAPHVHSVVAVDAAEGMIDVLKQKLSKPQAPTNILPLALLLENPQDPALPAAAADAPDGPRRAFDLITSHLVLHHIPDLRSVLETMFSCLAPGGCAMLTDFEDFGPEARRFHAASKMDGVARHGIHPRDMKALMEDVGFGQVEVKRHWTMQKTVEKFEGQFGESGKETGDIVGEVMDFPFVICYGVKV